MLCPDTLLLLREELLSRNDLSPDTIREIFKPYLNNYTPVTVAAEPETSPVHVSQKTGDSTFHFHPALYREQAGG